MIYFDTHTDGNINTYTQRYTHSIYMQYIVTYSAYIHTHMQAHIKTDTDRHTQANKHTHSTQTDPSRYRKKQRHQGTHTEID